MFWAVFQLIVKLSLVSNQLTVWIMNAQSNVIYRDLDCCVVNQLCIIIKKQELIYLQILESHMQPFLSRKGKMYSKLPNKLRASTLEAVYFGNFPLILA